MLMQRLYAWSALPKQDVQEAQADIEKMLAMFERIREVDTEGVEPMHTLPYARAFSAGAMPEEDADVRDMPGSATVDVQRLKAPQMRGALFEVPYTLEKGVADGKPAGEE